MRFIAIDPGQRTGWCSGHVEHTPGGAPRLVDLEHGVLPLKEFALQLADWQNIGARDWQLDPGGGWARFDVIVYETWQLFANVAQAMIGDDMQPSQQIGQIRLIAWLSHAHVHTFQPSQKEVFQASMPTWVADRKKDSNEEHDKDAIDLAWGYFFKHWFDPTKEPV